MENNQIIETANLNQKKAWEIIEDANIIEIWKSIGAEINLVGSLRTGLLMTHRDIDFHIYSSPLNIAESFSAMSKLSENKNIKRIEFINLTDTDEKCIEWHAFYEDKAKDLWQIDMIHILKGSFYDGYFENVADRILAVLDDEKRYAILRLKYETPPAEKIIGIEYYKAVIEGGVRSYEELMIWKKENPISGVLNWVP